MSAVPRDQVAAVGELLDRRLGASVLGLYLYGSAVDGGLRPESDLDVFGVVHQRLGLDERRAVVDGLLPLSGRDTRPAHWRPVELTLVARDEVVPWRYPPRLDFQYGEWLRPAFLAGDVEPWPPANPDVAVLITMVLGLNEVIAGPPAGELLDPVPRADLLRAMSDELEPLLGDLQTDTRNVLLTLARIWMTAATDEVRSKDVAAAWASERLAAPEHRSLLLRARAGYLGEGEDRGVDDAGVRSLAGEILSRIDQAEG